MLLVTLYESEICSKLPPRTSERFYRLSTDVYMVRCEIMSYNGLRFLLFTTSSFLPLRKIVLFQIWQGTNKSLMKHVMCRKA